MTPNRTSFSIPTLLIYLLCGWLGCGSLGAADKEPTQEEIMMKVEAMKAAMNTLAASLKYEQGTIKIKDGLATLNLSPEYRYLNSDQTKIVIEKLWGNPSGEGTLGMILPTRTDPLDDNGWGVIITYEEDGYVKDDDAEKINYDDLLKEMKASTVESNKARVEQGYGTIELVGWAIPPRYDKATHKLYWAKELKFRDAKENSLNYDIRVLGRHGVLVLSAVSSMKQLELIQKESPVILGMVEFNEGSRYTDFDPKMDKIATYGIAGLVAGGILTKTGLLKGLFVALLAAKKFVIIGLVAVGGFIKKIFSRKKE